MNLRKTNNDMMEILLDNAKSGMMYLIFAVAFGTGGWKFCKLNNLRQLIPWLKAA